MNIGKWVVAAGCTAILGGCAYPGGGGSGSYRYGEVGGEQSVRFGVVESVREVRIEGYDSGVGTTTGAVLGGIAGSNVGGGNGQVAGAVVGAVLGGIVGQSVERSQNERRGIEVTVLLDSGKYVAVVQQADEAFRAGDRVRVLSSRGATRVTH